MQQISLYIGDYKRGEGGEGRGRDVGILDFN
jgi:hypothetical protein